MATVDRQELLVRPLSMTTFQRDLDKFEEYIADVTLRDLDASVDEKRQKINETLRYEPFCEQIRFYFGPDIKTEDIKAIFRKISTNPEVKIDWSEVFGYFQAENEEGVSSEEISVFTVSKRKKIGEAAGDKKRRDIIQCITYSREHDLYVTASQKGALSIYNCKLRLQNCIDVNEPAWMTSCEYLPRLRKVIATTERTIVIWDHRAKANNLSSIYVIKPLEHSPRCLCLLPSNDDHSDTVLIGDDAGYVNIVGFTANDFASNTNKDPKRAMRSQVIDPASMMVPIVRRKFHPDWVLQIQYLPDINSFASCSPSDKTSFIISELKRLFDTQPVRELSVTKGVNAFAYSKKSNIFATGGVDKIIRVWHPNILSRPTGKMIGHLFTVISVVINDKDQHIISLSTARVFRVWDIHTLTCLQVFTDTEQKHGEKRISCMLFDHRHDRLFTGSGTVDTWPMTRTVQDTMSVPHTHDHPLTVIAMNKSKEQILTACSESIVKVWEINTGRQMYQIMEAHGLGVEITSASINPSGTRMVTGAYDGSIKICEFGSGQELKSFAPDPPREDDQTIMWITYLDKIYDKLPRVAQSIVEAKEREEIREPEDNEEEQHTVRRILAVGWNNKLRELEVSDENDEITFVRDFDAAYEWPPTPKSTPEPEFNVAKEIGSDYVHAEKTRKNIIGEEENDTMLRKEDILLHHEITCCSLMDNSIASVAKYLLSGCSNGNLILWNHLSGKVENVFELEKAEMPSRYESRERLRKEVHPYRVNSVGCLCHRIYQPDPEELKRRRKLLKKRTQEMEEGTDEKNGGDERKANVPVQDEDNNNQQEDDPAEEADLELLKFAEESDEDGDEVKSSEERQLFDFEQEPIKMVRVDFPPVIVSCHQDSNVRIWSISGQLRNSLTPTTKVSSPITSMCYDENANYLMVADTKGYITMWDFSELLQRPQTTSSAISTDLAKQLICWRAHLMKIVSLAYVDKSNTLISASTDGSVRVWYPQQAQYIGYFGQHRIWYLSLNPSLPTSPVLPYDINEGPVKAAIFQSSRKKPQTKKYDYPLIFDADRWRPFRRSAYDRELLQLKSVLPDKTEIPNLEVRNKKFFKALIKPKADKTNLDSSKPAEPESGAIFRALPVYRLNTPPPQPTTPSMDFITGGASWQGDVIPVKAQKKSHVVGKTGKSRIIAKKQATISAVTPTTATKKKHK